MSKIEVRQTEAGRDYYLRIVAANGEVVLHSESYSTRWNARRAARRLSRQFQIPWTSV